MPGRLIQSLLEMMRLRSGPQDLPRGQSLAVILALVYIAQGFIADRVLDASDAAPRTLVAIGIQFALITALLKLRGLNARVHQTIAALAGTGFLFGLLSIALLSAVDPSRPQAEIAFLYLGLFLWSLAVDGHIYRHALSATLGLGVLLAVLIFLVNFLVLRALFG
jgi:hypothetical protein